MDARTKSAILWGLVGALAFGVLYQGYVLSGAALDRRVLAGGMAVVGVVSIALARGIEGRLAVEES